MQYGWMLDTRIGIFVEEEDDEHVAVVVEIRNNI